MIATALYATIVAGIFGTVFAFVRHRLPAWSEAGRVGLLAAVAFGSVVLVPTLKYPANPPGVGAPETVDQRTLQYVAVLAVSVAVAVGLFWLAGWLRGRVAPSARPALVVLATVVAYALGAPGAARFPRRRRRGGTGPAPLGLPDPFDRWAGAALDHPRRRLRVAPPA